MAADELVHGGLEVDGDPVDHEGRAGSGPEPVESRALVPLEALDGQGERGTIRLAATEKTSKLYVLKYC